MIRVLGRVSNGNLHALNPAVESIAARAVVLGDGGAVVLTRVSSTTDCSNR
jgi:hypothetical protein